MSSPAKQIYDSYHFGSSLDLTDQHLGQLIRLFHTPTDRVDSVLGGRSSVTISQLEGIGSVVIKHYTRGGLIRYVVTHRYVKWGKTRSQVEYEVLQKVRGLGVNVPEPVAFAYRGKLFYNAWLVTREINRQQTLAELSCLDEEHARIVMNEVVVQVVTLIKNNIHHTDLHPGNILVDNADRVFVLDFDKACVSRGNRNKLQYKYLMRWQRAVTKHRLPEMLSEMMSAGLQKKFMKRSE